MRQGRIDVYPDVRASGNLGEMIPTQWQYMQHFRGTLDSGRLLIWMNGGVLDVIEDRYVAISDGHRCEWHRIAGSSDTEGETGMATVCRTPPSWPDSKRWLLAWSGSYRRVSMQTPYRVWVGLATAPAPTGPWTCHSEAIRSQHLVVTPPPPNDWWPPGMWASSLVVKGERVYLLTMDTGVPFPGTKPRSALWEVKPDLSAQVVGGIKLADEGPRSCVFDVALRADGTLLCMTGDSSHRVDPLPPAEYAVPEWNPDAVCVASRTGRTFTFDGDPLPSDPGYVRTPEGGLVEPVTFLGDWTSTVNPTARDWRGGWSSDPGEAGNAEVARLLSVAPARPHLEPAGMYYEFPYVNDLMLGVNCVDGAVAIRWKGQTLTFSESRTVEMAREFIGFTDPSVERKREAGEDFALTMVAGKCIVYARRASGLPVFGASSSVHPTVVKGRW